MQTDSPGDRQMSEVLRRVQTLERQNRRFRLLAVAAIALGAGIAARSLPSTPATTPAVASTEDGDGRARTVTAGRFVLLDAEGRSRVELKGHDLVFYADDGSKRMELGTTRGSCPSDPSVENTGAFFNFFDADGKLRAGLTSNGKGWSTLAFYGADGRGCANLNVSDDCRSALVIGNGEGGLGRLHTDENRQVNFDLLEGDEVRWSTRSPAR